MTAQNHAKSDSAPHPREDRARVQPDRQPDKTEVFKTTPQGELKIHFYFPPDWTKHDQRPAIIFWFGGGFKHGTPQQFYAKTEYFAARGLVCACAEYRVKNAHGTLIEKCVEDARSAIRWVKGHADELGIDTEKIIASGGSAGGTLSLLLSRLDGPDAASDDLKFSVRPCALVLFNPAVGERVLNVTGHGGEEQAAVNQEISALHMPRPGEPPSIFFFGTQDHFVEVSREFCRKAQMQGNRCELWTAQDMPHGFFNSEPWHSASLRRADEFLSALGYVEGAPTIDADAQAILKREFPA